VVASKEVYNLKRKIRRDRLKEHTPVEALVNEISESDDWAARYTTDLGGHINFFFFANALSIGLVQSYPDVILIDATYRTNRYNMPLVHFLGVTAVGTTFSLAFCFLSSENDLQYCAAVAAFKELVLGDAKVEVFLTDDDTNLKTALSQHFPEVPQLLCVWHVNKNVQTEASKLWRVNNVSEEENTANKEKRKEFMAKWEEASCELHSPAPHSIWLLH